MAGGVSRSGEPSQSAAHASSSVGGSKARAHPDVRVQGCPPAPLGRALDRPEARRASRHPKVRPPRLPWVPPPAYPLSAGAGLMRPLALAAAPSSSERSSHWPRACHMTGRTRGRWRGGGQRSENKDGGRAGVGGRGGCGATRGSDPLKLQRRKLGCWVAAAARGQRERAAPLTSSRGSAPAPARRAGPPRCPA